MVEYSFNGCKNMFKNFMLCLGEAMLTDETHEVDKIYSSKIGEKKIKQLQTNT